MLFGKESVAYFSVVSNLATAKASSSTDVLSRQSCPQLTAARLAKLTNLVTALPIMLNMIRYGL